MLKLALLAVAAASLMTITTAAHADTYRFDVDDPAATLGGQSFENYYFFLDSSPTVTVSDSDSFSLDTTDYGHTYSDDQVLDNVTFYTTAGSGGFENNFSSTFGPQVFTGSTTNPTFILGSYTFDGGETLTISDTTAVSAAPEPSVWMLMIAGVAMVGGALRFGRGRRAGNTVVA